MVMPSAMRFDLGHDLARRTTKGIAQGARNEVAPKSQWTNRAGSDHTTRRGAIERL